MTRIRIETSQSEKTWRNSHRQIFVNIVQGPSGPGPWFNIKTSSYQYRKSHCGDKTVVRSSYLHNGISYSGKMTSLYWFGPQNSWCHPTWYLTQSPMMSQVIVSWYVIKWILTATIVQHPSDTHMQALYWNGNIVNSMKFSSLYAAGVDKMTTSGAISDENFIIMRPTCHCSVQ